MLADIIPKLAAMEQEEDGPYYPRPSLASPSIPDDPGRCVRALTYARLGEPPKPWPGRFLLLLDDSSWHEELTIDWLQKSPYRIHSRQMPIDIPLPRPLGHGGHCRRCNQPIPNTILHGHIEGIFTDLLNVDRLLEHKAVNRFSFEERLKAQPALDHLTQACLYLGGLQRINPELREALLLYKSKDTSAYAEFVFTYDEKADRCHVLTFTASEGIHQTLDRMYDGLVTSALEKFEAVERHAEVGELPTRPYRADSWRCGYCRHAHRCWDGYPQEVDARDDAAQLPADLHSVVQAYAQASAIKATGERITKRLRPQLLAAMEAADAKAAVAGAHRVTVSVSERTELDHAKIPAEVRENAEVSKLVETLRVAALKQNAGRTTADSSGPSNGPDNA